MQLTCGAAWADRDGDPGPFRQRRPAPFARAWQASGAQARAFSVTARDKRDLVAVLVTAFSFVPSTLHTHVPYF